MNTKDDLVRPKRRGRPALDKQDSSVMIGVKVPENFKAALSLQAERKGVSLSTLMRDALSRELTEN